MMNYEYDYMAEVELCYNCDRKIKDKDDAFTNITPVIMIIKRLESNRHNCDKYCYDCITTRFTKISTYRQLTL